MAISNIQDITNDFNNNSGVWVLDVDSWDYVVVQLVSPSGTVTFKTTNDSGDIQGSGDGNQYSATNFINVQGTDLASGSGVTSLAATGLVKFSGIGKYLQLTSSSATVTKAIVRLYKIF